MLTDILHNTVLEAISTGSKHASGPNAAFVREFDGAFFKKIEFWRTFDKQKTRKVNIEDRWLPKPNLRDAAVQLHFFGFPLSLCQFFTAKCREHEDRVDKFAGKKSTYTNKKCKAIKNVTVRFLAPLNIS